MRAKSSYIVASVLVLGLWMAASCAPSLKISRLRRSPSAALLSLPSGVPSPAKLGCDSSYLRSQQRDTIRVVDFEGKEMFLMSAVEDEDGNMVAASQLDAAVVVARFRNVAERNGKVDLRFSVIVPQNLHDRLWQLRYTPIMYILEDSLQLDKVFITGETYRKRQLRGYQQYNRFLSSIITDSAAFVDMRSLEVFLRRNIPALYAFRNDSSYVDDDTFYSSFGVNSAEALQHYTNRLSRYLNEKRSGRRDEMFRRYVKAPFPDGNIRLDTVIRDMQGNYEYEYVQTITARPRLRKVDIFLDGEIYDRDICLMRIPRSEALTFFISSLSALVDGRERYVTKVVERRVRADESFNIDFPVGSSEVRSDFAANAVEISRVKEKLLSLMENEVFDVDSVVVVSSCSPEGSWVSNAALSSRRSRSISDYFRRYMAHKTDSLNASLGYTFNLDDTWDRHPGPKYSPIAFTGGSLPENWEYLGRLVENDTVMTLTQKEEYFAYMDIPDPDIRERRMKNETWYAHLQRDLYPQLRRVQFQFALSRRGMQKDTVETTVIDSLYMSGIQAIRDRNYETALEILTVYDDFNTAVAMLALDRNLSAISILEKCPESASRDYMLAVAYSRRGMEEKAVQLYLNACRMNQQFIHRGNLDPEISALIKKYSINFNQLQNEVL